MEDAVYFMSFIEQDAQNNFFCRSSETARLKRYLEGLSLWASQQETWLFFRKRAAPLQGDEQLLALESRKDSGFSRGASLFFCTTNQVTFQTIRVFSGDPSNNNYVEGNYLVSVDVKPCQRANDPAVQVRITDLFRTWFPDVALRCSPRACTGNNLKIMFNMACIQNPSTVVLQVPLGGSAARRTAWEALLRVYCGNIVLLHTMTAWQNMSPQNLTLSERMVTVLRKYAETGSRFVWRQTAAYSSGHNIFPLNRSRGITATVASLAGGWWSDADAGKESSTEYPIPWRQTGLNANAQGYYNVACWAGEKKTFLNDEKQYLWLWTGYSKEEATWRRVLSSDPASEVTKLYRDLKLVRLPLLRRGSPVEDLMKPIQNLPVADKDDAYENLTSLTGNNSVENLEYAGLLGTLYHKNITYYLVSKKQMPLALVGHLRMNFVQRDTRPPDKNPEIQRRHRAERALRPLPLTPLDSMSKFTIRELENYVKREVCQNINPQFSWLGTEFPVYFPFLYTTSGQPRGTFFETRADAVVSYHAPPSRISTGTRGFRIGVVEFKSIYGRDAVVEELPKRQHVAQALMTAWMFWHNTGICPDRVFLVYTTRWKRGAIFDYPFYPKELLWQSLLVKEWMDSLGDDCYYVDKQHLFAYTQQNNSLFRRSTTELPLEIFNFVHQDTFGARLQPAAPSVVFSGSLLDGDPGPDLGRFRNNYFLRIPPVIRSAVQDYPKHHVDFLPRADPRTPPVAAAVGYRSSTRLAKLVEQAEQRQTRSTSQNQHSRTLKDTIAGYVTSQLGNLSTITPSILKEQLESRAGLSSDEEPPVDSTDTHTNKKKNTELIFRSIHRMLNRKLFQEYGYKYYEAETLAHRSERGLMTNETLLRLLRIFNNGSIKGRVKMAVIRARKLS